MKAYKRHQALYQKLSELLGARDRGLITQAEYEQGLDDLRLTLPPHSLLMEIDLREGGTRFLVRRPGTGEILDLFDFRRSYCADH
ncbi:MAG TPA: hypothetical protein P5055_19140 [Candidatus Paceibacterota bacterium]|nr:hypothetical protein [Verrucomicrobiota bacterium]HSA02853.1 hypothetical protein [Candidatus Paceibacterota bacterium]